MKKEFTSIIVVSAMIIGLILTAYMVAFSQEAKTIKGEVIDVSCYVAAGAKGMDHRTCAIDCLKAGEPAGILEEGTNKVYLVVTEDHATNPATKVLPFVAKMVEATGTVSERGGLSTIDIKEIKEIQSQSMDMKSMPEGSMMKNNMKMGGY
jgi:hypothetical protein